MIVGTWTAQYDSLKITLVMKKDNGSITYLPENKTFKFKYSFRNDSLIRIEGEKEGRLHKVKFSDKNRLRFFHYPSTMDESVDLIDMVEFPRK